MSDPEIMNISIHSSGRIHFKYRCVTPGGLIKIHTDHLFRATKKIKFLPCRF